MAEQLLHDPHVRSAVEQVGRERMAQGVGRHVFPQVGQQISKAIDTIASGQMTAKEALAQAQANAIADLRRAGVKL